MSRSGYDDYDYDEGNWSYIRYRGMVASATRGKRGQQLLRDILLAMNGMKIKQLIADELEDNGAVCAIGAAGKMRGVDMSNIDPEDYHSVAGSFNVADCLAREIVWENDDCGPRKETPEQRFIRMRNWLRSQIEDKLFDVVWC